MTWQPLWPLISAESPEEVADRLLRSLAAPIAPFSQSLLEPCARFGDFLLRHPEAKKSPALLALGFWMRRSALTQLAASFAHLETPETVLVPAGLIFHLPPGNVDTLFVYSWALSFLCGNVAVVRIPERALRTASQLFRLFDEALAHDEEALTILRERVSFVTYGHEEEITRQLSARADVRVIWGGDATVQSVRAVPLPALGRDVGFGDRWSMSVLDANSVVILSNSQLDLLADRFWADISAFDQMACSSPRLVIWVGDDSTEAQRRFEEALVRAAVARAYAPPTGAVVDKQVMAFEVAARGIADRIEFLNNALTNATVASLDKVPRITVGAGFLMHVHVVSLASIACFVARRDQTLTHYGFSIDELRELVQLIGGRGLDRMVPVGEALRFGRYWDGYDLLQVFTRRVVVTGRMES